MPRMVNLLAILALLGAAACTPAAATEEWVLRPLVPRPDSGEIQDQNDLMASASADGKSVLFTSQRTGTFRLYVMDVDGSNQHAITSGPGTQMQGSFSPDGSRIAYVQRQGDDAFYAVANADGSDAKMIAPAPRSWPIPMWSPDGTRILYHAPGTHGKDDIWSAPVAGGEPQLLFGSPESDLQPQLSPDGSRIVFISRRDGADFEIYVARADGSEWTQLTDNQAPDYTPSWSPDGTRIVYQSPRAGHWTIMTINADGSDETPVTTYPMQWDPAWSYDGSQIFFNSGRTGRRGIEVINADGSDPRKLTNTDPGDFVRLVREADVDTAASVFRTKLAASPGAVYFYEEEVQYLGDNYLEMGDLRRATLLFEINTEAYPDSSTAYANLGKAYLAAGDRSRARESYARAVELDADNTQAASMLARLRA